MGSKAPEGLVWICGACGKRSKDRYKGTIDSGWDESCMIWAILCYEDSIKTKNGRIYKATAVKESVDD